MTRVDDVMLMAYVDGEVDAETARQIEHAISTDSALSARARMFRESASLLRGAYADALHEKVPDRLLAAAGGAARPTNVVALATRRPAARQIFGWAVAASLAALVIGGGGTYWYVSENRAAVQTGMQQAAAERWLDHVTGFYDVYDAALKSEDRRLVDFKADDIPELQNWFSARLNRPLSVPDLSAQGFRPQGGRLLIINGKPAAQFLYTSDGGEVVGLVIAFTTGDYQPARTERRQNLNIVHWRNAGYAYAFVGTVEAKRLQQLADKAWRDLGKT
jgi:anti-sigma factor RsiW